MTDPECPQVRKLFVRLLRMGRELGMRLIALSTGRSVEDLGLKGRGDLRRNLVTVRLGSAATEVRPDLARLPRPALLELRGQAIPLDLSEVTPAVPALPPARHWRPAGQTPALGSLTSANAHASATLAATSAHASATLAVTNAPASGSLTATSTPANTNEPVSAPPSPVAPASPPESPETAWESAETAFGEEISAVETAMIRGAIAAGKGKTETLQALKGYSGRRHRAYSAAWERALRG